MTKNLRSVLNALRHTPHLLVLTLAVVLAACSGDDPTRPQSVHDPLAGAVPGPSLPDDPEFGDFSADEIDPSDIEYNGEDGPFQHVVRVQSGLELVFRFNGKIRAREEVSITLRARGDGKAVRGNVAVDFGDGRRIKGFEVDRTAELTHTYREEGRYRIFVVLLADDGRKARGGFRLVVDEMIRVDLLAEFRENPRPGEEVAIDITARGRDSNKKRKTAGVLTVGFGDGTTKVLKNFEESRVVRHTYEKEGDYVLALVLEMNGRDFAETMDVEVNDGPGGGDEFDLRQAIVMGNSAAGVAHWQITSQVTGVSISPGQICIFHTKAGQWPIWQGVEGNPWVVANIGGKWYAGTYEWVRPGQVCKGITAGNIGPHIKFAPMHSWRPRQGEVVYLFMSTLARLGARSTNERSNTVRAVWSY